MPTAISTDPHPDVPDAPAIAGLTWRTWRDAADFPAMVAVRGACAAADGVEDAPTVESLARSFANRKNFDPRHDVLLAEIDGDLAGFTTTGWWEQLDGVRVYHYATIVRPASRGQGLEPALLHWAERRLRAIAQDGPPGESLLDTGIADSQTDMEALLRSAGYTPTRHFYDMVRPDLEQIPDMALPAGLEVRPVQPDQFRAIWEAEVEAFRDHWGEEQVDEADFVRWQNHKQFQPDLWQVAWDGDQVAGMVRTYIDADFNARFGKRRGYTENISTRRPWRKRGLAAALIARSLRLQQERGMTESALGVDTANPSGALRVYEKMGFRAVQRFTSYRKPLA